MSMTDRSKLKGAWLRTSPPLESAREPEAPAPSTRSVIHVVKDAKLARLIWTPLGRPVLPDV